MLRLKLNHVSKMGGGGGGGGGGGYFKIKDIACENPPSAINLLFSCVHIHLYLHLIFPLFFLGESSTY